MCIDNTSHDDRIYKSLITTITAKEGLKTLLLH